MNALRQDFTNDLLDAIVQDPIGQAEVTPISRGRGTVHRRPYWVNDSTLIVYRTGYDVISGLYLVNSHTGANELLHSVRLPEDAYYSLSDSSVLYARYVRDRFVPTKWIADIYRLNLQTTKVERLTHGGRLFAPVQRARVFGPYKTKGSIMFCL